MEIELAALRNVLELLGYETENIIVDSIDDRGFCWIDPVFDVIEHTSWVRSSDYAYVEPVYRKLEGAVIGY